MGAALQRVEALMEELASPEPHDVLGLIAREHLATGGKRLRARLALEATEALGGRMDDAVGWAASCELLHNATLIHDDVQDGDRGRRGQPAVWVRHGEAQAINAGDLLLMLPYLALERIPASAERRWLLVRTLASCAVATARGQAAEQWLSSVREVGWSSYERAVAGKTSALFRLPVEGAALLAGREAGEAGRVGEAFHGLGMLFQLQDDVLDLYGDKGKGGPGSDLREGKVTALVVEHLKRRPADATWLRDTAARDVPLARRRFEESGALQGVLSRIEAEAARLHASPALKEERAMRELAGDIADLVLQPVRSLLGPVLR